MALFLISTGRSFYADFYIRTGIVPRESPRSTNVMPDAAKSQIAKLSRFMSPWIKHGYIFSAPDPASVQATRIMLGSGNKKSRIIANMSHLSTGFFSTAVRVAEHDRKFFSNVEDTYWLPSLPCDVKRCLEVVKQIDIDPSSENVIMIAGADFVRKFISCFSVGNMARPVIDYTCSILHHCPETKKILPLVSVDPSH